MVKCMQNKIIPSFGRRRIRQLKKTCDNAYKNLLPFLKVNPTQGLFEELSQDIWLEIGFGGGEHMVEQLARNPAIQMVGCEPFINGMAKCLTQLKTEDYGRVKLWEGDVRELLPLIPGATFSKVFILFPDPWPKKRHYHRRLITIEFINQLSLALKEEAFLYIASDDVTYVEHIQEVLKVSPHFTPRCGPLSPDPSRWTPRPQDWPSTRYEQKALAEGKKCAYMVFQKKEVA